MCKFQRKHPYKHKKVNIKNMHLEYSNAETAESAEDIVWLHSCQNSKLVNTLAPTSELLQPNQSTFEIPLIQ